MTRIYTLAFTLAHHLIEVYRRIFRPVTVGVRIMLLKDERILLVRHTYMDTDSWYFPGGGLNRGETMEQAARREAWEETGVIVKDIQLVGIFTLPDSYNTNHNILYASTAYEEPGKDRPAPHSHEIAACQAFSIHELPVNMAAGQTAQLAEFLKNK